MPRDIQVFIESRVDDGWQVVLPMVRNTGFNHENTNQNQINDSMFITEYYPEPIYEEYNPKFWELFGVEGKYSSNSREIPTDCCKEIRDYYLSFGDEAFQEHWISSDIFISNVGNSGTKLDDANSLVSKIKSLGNLGEMRLILWFSQ